VVSSALNVRSKSTIANDYEDYFEAELEMRGRWHNCNCEQISVERKQVWPRKC
jgi:hypothetical protein